MHPVKTGLWSRRRCRNDGCVARRAASCGSRMAASLLPQDPPGTGALRDHMVAFWLMAEGLQSAAFLGAFGRMWRVRLWVFLWAWGRMDVAPGA